MYKTEQKSILGTFIFHFFDCIQISFKFMIIFTFLIYVYAEPFIDTYNGIYSNICTKYSNITKKEVKYFGVVGCFEKIDNNWVKVN